MSRDYIQPTLEEWVKKFRFETYTKVRVCETDMYVHVNNTSYSLYFEQGRADYLEALGFYDKGLAFIVGDFYCRYHSEAYARDELVIKVRTATLGTKSFKVESVIQHKDTNEVIATSWATLIVSDDKEKKTITLPQWVRENINEYERVKPLSKIV